MAHATPPGDPSPGPVLIVGCGYLGTRAAARWSPGGREVTGTTRSPERRAAIEAAGARAALLDLEHPEDSPALDRRYAAVVWAVAPGRGGDPRLAWIEGPRRVLAALPAPPERLVFLSSTGVYAQRSGEEVDESSPARSDAGRGPWLLRAERELAAEATRPRAIVLRLGGLWGPGRSPLVWIRRPGFACRRRGSGAAWMNWIHVEDAADAVVAADARGVPGRVYLVVDGHPVRRGDLYARAAELAGVAPPPLDEDGDLGKRCANVRLREELGVAPRHPDIVAGLGAGDAS